MGAYQDRLHDPAQRMDAAKAFVTYELSISHLFKNHDRIAETMKSPEALVPFAALEVHYMLYGGFMRRGQLLDEILLVSEADVRRSMCDLALRDGLRVEGAGAVAVAALPKVTGERRVALITGGNVDPQTLQEVLGSRDELSTESPRAPQDAKLCI